MTHNDWELSQELETTPPPKKTTKPPAPPDHIFSSIKTDLQQAFPDNDANTTVDTINNKVSVKYLYDKEKLLKLDENFFGATKRASVLHYNIFPKPDIASGMDWYIYEQVDNGNYVEINPSEAHLNHQLHFIGYNFVFSSTSSSLK